MNKKKAKVGMWDSRDRRKYQGFPVNQKLEMYFLCAADDQSSVKGKEKQLISKLL